MLLAQPSKAVESTDTIYGSAQISQAPNVFLLGATPSISSVPTDGSLDKLRRTGGNTGNQIIAHALLSQIQYDELAWDHTISPHEVRERFDIFVIAAANFLFPSFDFGGMADYIEKTGLPVAIVGLGAQSSDYDPNIVLKAGTERFLKVVSERAVSIGVRGPFTQEVLHRRGIRNVTTTGCPSFYMHGASTLDLRKPDFDCVKKIAINASRDVIKHAFDPEKMRKIVREIYQLGINWHADFISQSENAEIKLSEGIANEERKLALDEICEFMNGAAPDIEVRAWASQHLRVFFEVNDWVAAIKKYDFVLGNRFHGNMIAIQNGVPAIVICHDTRTEDMCKFLGLPNVSIVDLDSIDVKELYASVDCSTLNARYKILFPQYIEFLRLNNLSPKAPGAMRQ